MLIFFDIDGTLLGGRSQTIPDSAKAAIEQARERGHICVINTGRTLRLVGPELTGQVEFDGLLLGCGTMILYRGDTLVHRTFSEEEAARIIEGLRRYRIDALLEGIDDIFREKDESVLHEVFRKYICLIETYILKCKDYSEAPGRFDKFYAYTEEPAQMSGFAEEFEDLLEVVDRKEGYYEVMPKGYSKATAMRCMAEALKIPMSETAAIGDSSNDIPMLQCAGVGIAMGNATEDVKEIADFVTTEVERDGIRNALRWLGAIE